MYVQLLGVWGKATIVENCHPEVTGLSHSGKLCTCWALRSAEVNEPGRAIPLVSMPIHNSDPASQAGRKSTSTWFKRCSLMHPSSKASYRLGHRRSKWGDSDNSGNEWARSSVSSASTVLNNASPAR